MGVNHYPLELREQVLTEYEFGLGGLDCGFILVKKSLFQIFFLGPLSPRHTGLF